LVHNSRLEPKDLVELTDLLASMVVFSDHCLRDDMSPPLRKATDALPDIVNKFAEDSRTDEGERLKKRALRHALDPKAAPPDCGAGASVIRHNGKLSLSISQTMAPSFQNDVVHCPTVAFTAEDLLAAFDDSECKAGPTDDCRHLCVHILPALVQLTLPLFEALDEHHLVEPAERWHPADDATLSNKETTTMIVALRNLAAASGTSWKSADAATAADAFTETPSAARTANPVAFNAGRNRHKCAMQNGCCRGREGPWRRVPLRCQDVGATDSETSRVRLGKRRFCRMEWLCRAAHDPNGSANSLRICGLHQFVEVVKSFPCQSTELDEDERPKKKTESATFLVPDNSGPKAFPTTASKGLARDRLAANIVTQAADHDKENDGWRMALLQTSQLSEDSETCDINKTVRNLSGLNVHHAPLTQPASPSPSPSPSDDRDPSRPRIALESITSDDIKVTAGFPSKFALLSFVFIVCNGDNDVVMQKETLLTWFEEWLACFQWIWGRESMTEELLAKSFGIHRKTLAKILESKQQFVLAARQRWPQFAGFEEDCALCSEKWK